MDTKIYLESETEDEEVKMNCIGGVQGIDESDMNTSDAENDNDLAEDDEDCTETEGVVKFVSDHIRSSFPLIRPKATPPLSRPMLSPHAELADESDSNSSEASSVGARGVPFALEVASEDESDLDEDDSENSVHDSINDDADELEHETSGSDADDESCEGGADDDYSDEELSTIVDYVEDTGHIIDPNDPASVTSYIGVTEDRDDHVTIPLQKRVLSYNTLCVLNFDAGHDDSPKRLKANAESNAVNVREPPSLPLLTIGPSFISEVFSPLSLLRHRSSPLIGSREEEALDRQLEEELEDHGLDAIVSRENTPVPLLTPPQSPLTVDAAADICEWPSNLTVDIALMNTQPMTPEAEDFSDEEWLRRSGQKATSESSCLTPLLRGISVAIP